MHIRIIRMDKSVAIGYALFLYAICEILLKKYFNIAYVIEIHHELEDYMTEDNTKTDEI